MLTYFEFQLSHLALAVLKDDTLFKTSKHRLLLCFVYTQEQLCAHCPPSLPSIYIYIYKLINYN